MSIYLGWDGKRFLNGLMEKRMEESKLYLPNMRQYTCMYLHVLGKIMKKKFSHIVQLGVSVKT